MRQVFGIVWAESETPNDMSKQIKKKEKKGVYLYLASYYFPFYLLDLLLALLTLAHSLNTQTI